MRLQVVHIVRDGPNVKKISQLLQLTGNVLVIAGWHGMRGGFGTYRVKAGRAVHSATMGNYELFKWMRPLLPKAVTLVGVYYDACYAGDNVDKDLPAYRKINSVHAQWEWGGVPIAGPVAAPLTIGSWYSMADRLAMRTAMN